MALLKNIRLHCR